MYCDKLINIVQNKDNEEHIIDESIIKKLDIFIKNKTTQRERTKLNPMKFSAKMNVEQEVALMTFIIGAQLELFAVRMYYSCICDGHFEFKGTSQPVHCYNCQESVCFSQDRNRVHLYFSLLEIPSSCSWDYQKNVYPLDYLESYNNEVFTLADLDKTVGKSVSDTIIGLSDKRENNMSEYLNEES